MHRSLLSLLTGLALAALSLAWATPASAHISLEQGGTHLSRYGDSEIKAGPCGRTGGKRGTHVYTYEPGQKITVSLVEFVAHPSYFRIAFDSDGDDGFKEPASIKPIDPKRKCPLDTGDHCGASDFYNSPAVLPGMDNLNPHMPSGTPKYTWTVTLPDVECTNCTLQIIQVMEDTVHGDYDPTPGVGIEDIYHQCIDLVLKRGASASDAGTGLGPQPDAGDSGGGGTTIGGGAGGGAGTGGGTGSGTGTGTGTGTSTGSGADADGGTTNGAADDANAGGCSAARGAEAPVSLAAGSLLAIGGLSVLRRRRRNRA